MKLLFPHQTIRPIQEQITKELLDTLRQKKHAIIHAPTGLGKTAASLAPALTIALEKNLSVIFLTSRQTQHKIVLETTQKIKQKHNTTIQSVSIIGKKWMCGQEGASTMPAQDFFEFCSSLCKDDKCNFYLNSKEKIKNSICQDELIRLIPTTENIITTSLKHQICPYETALILANKSNVIIADYFYLFNDPIRTNFLKKINKNLEDCIIIVDEAHNLPERIRELMSATLSLRLVQRAMNEVKKYELSVLITPLTELLDLIKKFGAGIQLNEEKKVSITQLNQELEKINNIDQLNAILKISSDIVREHQKHSALGVIANFIERWQEQNSGYIRYIKKDSDNIKIILQCLDPSLVTKPVIDSCYAMVLMSGTLVPTIMYQDVLGFSEGTFKQEYNSPFPEKNKLALIIPKTTTKFTQRSPHQYKQIAETCASITNKIPGNSLIFFPSYKLRDDVLFFFQEYTIKTILLEQPNFKKEQKEELLKKYISYNNAVMLCAATGSFGEGIDLPGINKCVIVVGLPLDRPDLKTKELIQYYDKLFGCGWDYGYTMPAITKTLQNAGRCIRSEKDKGVLVFLDERYNWPRYKKLFPQDWNLIVSNNCNKEIADFFNI